MIGPAGVAAVFQQHQLQLLATGTRERLAGHQQLAKPDRGIREHCWRRTIPADPRRLVRYKLEPGSRLFPSIDPDAKMLADAGTRQIRPHGRGHGRAIFRAHQDGASRSHLDWRNSRSRRPIGLSAVSPAATPYRRRLYVGSVPRDFDDCSDRSAARP